MKSRQLSVILRRLTPLYIAVFLQGIPLWYSIEKLFMLSIGFSFATIGVMVAIMSAVMILVETPSGILADRWSRRGVLMLGSGALALSGLIGALSYNEPIFIISTIFWGVYFAMYSGTYDSILYDTVLEEHGNNSMYEKYKGRFHVFEGAAFVIGALLGGVIADLVGMRMTFVVSLPFILLSFYFLYIFREPQLHKAEVAEPVFKHIRQTFAAVLRNPLLVPVIISIVGFAVIAETIYELSQLWYIAVTAPVILYGIFFATIASSIAMGGFVATWISSRSLIFITPTIVLLGLISLAFTRNFWVILVLQFAITICLVAVNILLSRRLHDELPSRLRAGSASVVSTISRIIIIPGSLIFTWVADRYSIFSSTYILVGLAGIATVALYVSVQLKRAVTAIK